MHIKHFKGHFSYLIFNETGEPRETDQQVPFLMTLNFEDDTFTGTTVDDESKGLFDQSITVNGFVDGSFISFIVMYPHNYFSNENGVFIVDYENEYPGCGYKGHYDSIRKRYVGNWTDYHPKSISVSGL